MAFFLLLFFAVEALGFQLLRDPTPWMQHGEVLAAALGVSLLVADVLLPVPSSLVMVAHGALFGVVMGTLLSLLGSMGAALFGFVIGRRGGKLLERIVTAGRARTCRQDVSEMGSFGRGCHATSADTGGDGCDHDRRLFARMAAHGAREFRGRAASSAAVRVNRSSIHKFSKCGADVCSDAPGRSLILVDRPTLR